VTGTTGARQIHHDFAHQLLPELFFFNTREIHAGLTADGAAHLRVLWKRLEQKRSAQLNAAGLDGAWYAGSDQSSLYLVDMPKPKESPEAQLTGLAWGPDAAPRSFLALEKGCGADTDFMKDMGIDPASIGPQPSWMLGEWLPSGKGLTHANHGEAQPGREAFLRAVSGRLGCSFRPGNAGLVGKLKGWLGK
jgi:hypothetical protein